MEIINPSTALLSNFEVLSLLRELESDQLAETRAALAVKRERAENGLPDLSNLPNEPPIPEVCENLRTVEFEAIAYLSAPHQPSLRQTGRGIRKLVKALAPYGLTKAEKLQIVNLAPIELVELYVIVEELEDRLSDKIDEILGIVRASLTNPAPENPDSASAPAPEDTKDEDADGEIVEDYPDADAQGEDAVDDDGVMEFINTEGAFDGDLDVEEADE